jgi:hypothetical protein
MAATLVASGMGMVEKEMVNPMARPQGAVGGGSTVDSVGDKREEAVRWGLFQDFSSEHTSKERKMGKASSRSHG